MWSQFAVVLLLCIYFDRAVSVDQQGGWIASIQPLVLPMNISYRTCVRVGGKFEIWREDRWWSPGRRRRRAATSPRPCRTTANGCGAGPLGPIETGTFGGAPVWASGRLFCVMESITSQTPLAKDTVGVSGLPI